MKKTEGIFGKNVRKNENKPKPKPEGIELTLFGKNAGANGQGTLMFYGVTDYREGVDELSFNYVSASSGNTKEAIFYITDLMGFSRTPY